MQVAHHKPQFSIHTFPLYEGVSSLPNLPETISLQDVRQRYEPLYGPDGETLVEYFFVSGGRTTSPLQCVFFHSDHFFKSIGSKKKGMQAVSGLRFGSDFVLLKTDSCVKHWLSLHGLMNRAHNEKCDNTLALQRWVVTVVDKFDRAAARAPSSREDTVLTARTVDFGQAPRPPIQAKPQCRAVTPRQAMTNFSLPPPPLALEVPKTPDKMTPPVVPAKPFVPLLNLNKVSQKTGFMSNRQQSTRRERHQLPASSRVYSSDTVRHAFTSFSQTARAHSSIFDTRDAQYRMLSMQPSSMSMREPRPQLVHAHDMLNEVQPNMHGDRTRVVGINTNQPRDLAHQCEVQSYRQKVDRWNNRYAALEDDLKSLQSTRRSFETECVNSLKEGWASKFKFWTPPVPPSPPPPAPTIMQKKQWRQESVDHREARLQITAINQFDVRQVVEKEEHAKRRSEAKDKDLFDLDDERQRRLDHNFRESLREELHRQFAEIPVITRNTMPSPPPLTYSRPPPRRPFTTTTTATTTTTEATPPTTAPPTATTASTSENPSSGEPGSTVAVDVEIPSMTHLPISPNRYLPPSLQTPESPTEPPAPAPTEVELKREWVAQQEAEERSDAIAQRAWEKAQAQAMEEAGEVMRAEMARQEEEHKAKVAVKKAEDAARRQVRAAESLVVRSQLQEVTALPLVRQSTAEAMERLKQTCESASTGPPQSAEEFAALVKSREASRASRRGVTFAGSSSAREPSPLA